MKTNVSSIPFLNLSKRHSFTSRALITMLSALLIVSGLSIGRRVIAARQSSVAANESPQEQLPNLRGQEAVDQLKQQGLYSSLQEAMVAARYEAQWVNQTGIAGMEGAYELKNLANNFRAYVNQDELRVLPLDGKTEKPWELGLKLVGLGYGEKPSSIAAGEVKATGNRVEIARQSAIGNRQSALKEWFVNSGRGLEHGFDISDAPGETKPGQPLRLRFDIAGDLKPKLNGAGNGVALTHDEGNIVLSYDKLFAQDAKGRALASRMKLEAGRLVIELEDAGAEYPLKIDPLLTQQVKLAANDGQASDVFGSTIAISGDTVVVGAYADDVGGSAEQGSIYVFVKNELVWSQQQHIVASDGAAIDEFGGAVGISGDTIVVGALLDNVGANNNQGSAYVFVRSGTVWSQQQKLVASDGASDDQFGVSAAISGETIVVGALGDDVGASPDQGSAYVFVRSGTVWSQQQKLVASDGATIDLFGGSVAIIGEQVVVGASGHNVSAGSAYIFVRSGTVWSEQQRLLASDGAPNDQFGSQVAINGNTVVVGAVFDDQGAAANQGSAYVFVRFGTVWSQQQKLLATDGAADDFFGWSVAISGDTVVIGAAFDDYGAATDQGSTYVFERTSGVWSQKQQLSSGAAANKFGWSVVISGDTVVVGAPGDDALGNPEQGSAYVFDCGRSEHAQVIADDGAGSDQFGFSVAISGETVVVGSPLDDVGANTDQGSAYCFVRSGTAWLQQGKLVAGDGRTSEVFGFSVAISGDTVVVGAFLADVGANTNQGSAYVFTRSGTTWTQHQKLTANDGAAGDRFGQAVGISGDTIVIGAPFDDVGATDRGSAYVFARSGAYWSQQQQLLGSDSLIGDLFGHSVAISGDTVVVGAVGDDVGANVDQGSAYVFVRSGTVWSQQQKLFAMFGGGAGDAYGVSVAISGDTVVIGASLFESTATDQGSVYIYVRSGTVWSQQLQIEGRFAGDQFGCSVAISGDTMVAASRLRDVGSNADQGRIDVYVLLKRIGPVRKYSPPPTARRLTCLAIQSRSAEKRLSQERISMTSDRTLIKAQLMSSLATATLRQQSPRQIRSPDSKAALRSPQQSQPSAIIKIPPAACS